jgi:hypothetical protein
MNAKKAKKLRRFMRKVDLDFRQRSYQVRVAKQVLMQIGDALVPQDRLQMRLHPESGRAVYRRLKPLWA